MAEPSSWSAPSLELAPGFKAPLPTDYQALCDYIETALPAESPIVYGMHPNAELSLLTSLGETLFRTVVDVTGGGGGAAGGGVSGEAAVRSALADYLERLPVPFIMVDLEAKVKDKTPYVVVALQEVRSGRHLLQACTHAAGLYSCHS
jgi:dynein heavy chain